jgi:hypothetical protein
VSLGPGEALPDPIIDLCAMNELNDLVSYVDPVFFYFLLVDQ